MPRVLEFNWTGGTLDLLAEQLTGSGWSLLEYKQAAGDLGGDWVTDSARIQASGDDGDALAGFVQDLDNVRWRVDRYRDNQAATDPVWLHMATDDETEARRALVRRTQLEWITSPLAEVGAITAHAATFTLQIERGPWERLTATSGNTLLSTSGVIIEWDYTGGAATDPVGDLPARVDYMHFVWNGALEDMTRLYMGFRSAEKHGTLANFEPIWCWADGTLNNGTEYGITTQADADTVGGTRVQVVPGAWDWDEDQFRLVGGIQLQDVSANEEDNFGEFLWLPRAMVSAADTTWEIQLRHGYRVMAPDQFLRGRIEEVGDTEYNLYEGARASIPLRDLKVFPLTTIADSAEAYYEVQLWARRTSGAGNLHLDCVGLIPLDEGSCKVAEFELVASFSDYLFFAEGPAGEVQAVAYAQAPTELLGVGAVDPLNFRVPVGDGRLYCAYADDDQNRIGVGGGMRAIISWWERWANMRGDE